MSISESPKKFIKIDDKLKSYQNIIEEVNEDELDRLYNNQKDYEKILPIFNFLKIEKCSILKYGIKKSKEEIKFSYCRTCDHNLLNPICLYCINVCHKGHLIKYIFKKAKIKCSCGEKNHYSKKINNINIIQNKNIICLCNEWNIIANLDFYYVNEEQKPICILCHNYCQKDNKKDKIIKLEKNKNIPKCSCNNLEIHQSHKTISETLIKLFNDYNEFHVLFHPIKFINLIFKSKNIFKLIFEDFQVFTNNLVNSEKSNSQEYFSKIYSINITNTNIYRTLLIFEKMIEKKTKYNYIYFYNEEFLNYFSFDIIKNLFSFLEQSPPEEKSFKILINKYLYLFHKFYINYKTKSINKIKLNDLRNLSFLQRAIIFNKNKSNFKESVEIISFLLKILIYLIFNTSSSLESIECIKEVMSIFRKLSCYNLMNNEQMINICINILKTFDYIRILRNNAKIYYNIHSNFKYNSDIKSKNGIKSINKILLKLYYIIMKIMMNFIYNYNYNILNIIILDKEKYSDINSITSEKVCFICNKNELGRFLFEINISLLSYIQK